MNDPALRPGRKSALRPGAPGCQALGQYWIATFMERIEGKMDPRVPFTRMSRGLSTRDWKPSGVARRQGWSAEDLTVLFEGGME